MRTSRPNITIIEANTASAGERVCAAENPDLVLLDLNLPDSGGLDVLYKLLLGDPKRRVIVFSMYDDPALVSRAIDVGAVGYVTKSDDPNSLLEAIICVAAGERYLSANAALRQVAFSNLSSGPPSKLSPRERETLNLLSEGLSLSNIADRLGVSYRTSASLVAQLRTKLQLPCTAALIRRAVELRTESERRSG